MDEAENLAPPKNSSSAATAANNTDMIKAKETTRWLNKEILAVTATPDFQQRMVNIALQPYADTPDEFDASIKRTYATFEKVVRQYNITD